MMYGENHLEKPRFFHPTMREKTLTDSPPLDFPKKKPVFCHSIRIKSAELLPQKFRDGTRRKKLFHKLHNLFLLKRPMTVHSRLLITLLFISHLLSGSCGAILKRFNTMDMLQDHPMISAAFIAQQNEACDMTKLCSDSEMDVAPICGTDGRTYNSLCEIRRAACHGNPVLKKYDGPCPENSKCKLERTFQEELAIRRNQSTVFIPECETDGSYSTVQCHKTTGYCWCVTKLGRPLPGTSVQFKRPDCFPQGKMGRRSSKRRLGTRTRRGCSHDDRVTFSKNLIEKFRKEFERDSKNSRKLAKIKQRQLAGRHTPRRSALSQKFEEYIPILEWQFRQLDMNRDGRVSRREIRGMKRIVKKIVKPRACAKNFTKYCDFNRDRKIEMKEWKKCLLVNMNKAALFSKFLLKEREQVSYKKPKAEGWIGSPSKEKASDRPLSTDEHMQNDPPADPLPPPLDSVDEDYSVVGMRGSGNIETASKLLSTGGGNKGTSSDFLLKETESTTVSPSEEANDCRSQRQKAIRENDENPTGSIYVPDCSGRGERRFSSVQCHKLTQFCWCADKETGKPISGTSSRYTRPDCEQVHVNLGDIKGCKLEKRELFFRRFYSTLESSMIISGHSPFSDRMSTKELAVRWKFTQLDTNKNNRLERREWKEYRRDMKTWKGVKKCGRNFLRFCDRDGNKKITHKEWIACALKAQGSGNKGTSSDFLLKETESTTVSPNEEANDCRSQRQKAIRENDENPTGSIYVPDCSGSGERGFSSVQCHNLTQFCWCADKKTGKPISGTSSLHTRPDCEQVHVNLGDIKGCKLEKRELFFRRFYSTLESSMIISGHSPFSDRMSTKELAVRWKFTQLDTNKNNRLERREWKEYRRDMKTWKGVKKCGRNFLRFCDRDGNKKIIQKEWIACALKAQGNATYLPPPEFDIGNYFSANTIPWALRMFYIFMLTPTDLVIGFGGNLLSLAAFWKKAKSGNGKPYFCREKDKGQVIWGATEQHDIH